MCSTLQFLVEPRIVIKKECAIYFYVRTKKLALRRKTASLFLEKVNYGRQEEQNSINRTSKVNCTGKFCLSPNLHGFVLQTKMSYCSSTVNFMRM